MKPILKKWVRLAAVLAAFAAAAVLAACAQSARPGTVRALLCSPEKFESLQAGRTPSETALVTGLSIGGAFIAYDDNGDTYVWAEKSGKLEKTQAYQVRRDEIGTLYHAYNRQQERIQELFVQVQDSLEKQKRAEIHALQVQMNPHFIYNTLGAISCRALLCGEDEIAEQITALTAIIR